MSERLPYTVEQAIDGVEVRSYAPMVLATVRRMPDNEAFGILFKYISGNNRSAKRSASERIPMTAPVFSGSDSFSFAVPPSYSIDTAPRPLDSRSVLESVPARRVAVLRFSGTAPGRTVAAKSRELLDTLARHGLRAKGSPFLMRYNAPFTPGFMRRNEVGVELQPS